MPTRGTTERSERGGNGKRFQSTCPRGARRRPGMRIQHSVTFQSTCPRGARPPVRQNGSYIQKFQSTCPRGARRRSRHSVLDLGYFNPRAHEGHDIVCTMKILHKIISIHVPTRGTTADFPSFEAVLLFQSTCPRGARRFRSVYQFHVVRNFNPRAHEGHDR